MNDDAVTARPATEDDAELLFGWRNDETTRWASRSGDVVAWDDHVAWLRRTLTDDGRVLLIVEAGEPIGTVRWDRLDDGAWELSITLAPAVRGRGAGRAVLLAGEAALGWRAPRRLVAVVRKDNVVAQRLFRSVGYEQSAPPEGGLLTLTKDLVGP
jgi:RimJ/RimL family protein N-acetyltransferase